MGHSATGVPSVDTVPFWRGAPSFPNLMREAVKEWHCNVTVLLDLCHSRAC